MTKHPSASWDEWLAARLELLDREQRLTRQTGEVARRRQTLPWVQVDKEYRFETDTGVAILSDLFAGRPRLLIYHFMFGPDFTAGCPTCTSIAATFNGLVAWLGNHGLTLCAVSQASLAKLRAYKEEMGWTFPWVSAVGSDFQHDFQMSLMSVPEMAADVQPYAEAGRESWAVDWAGRVGVNWATYRHEMAGLSVFGLEGSDVYYTYSSYERGLDEFSILNRIFEVMTMAES